MVGEAVSGSDLAFPRSVGRQTWRLEDKERHLPSAVREASTGLGKSGSSGWGVADAAEARLGGGRERVV